MQWTIDPTHALFEFSVKHMAISTVKGSFKSFSGLGMTGEHGLPTALNVEVETASIFTNMEQRDDHLRSADFFDAANHPKILFTATAITGERDDLTVVGDLTMRGVTKSISLKGELSEVVTDPWGNQRAALELTGKINRKEFGLVWNMALEFGGVMVSEDVKLHIAVEATAVAEAAVAV